MRVNIYADELPQEIEVVKKYVANEGGLIGLRFKPSRDHLRVDEDAITFWARDKEALQDMLRRASDALDYLTT